MKPPCRSCLENPDKIGWRFGVIEADLRVIQSIRVGVVV
jgi:hypothetical protein